MIAFRDGYYEFIDKYNITSKFSITIYNINFNDDYTIFYLLEKMIYIL